MARAKRRRTTPAKRGRTVDLLDLPRAKRPPTLKQRMELGRLVVEAIAEGAEVTRHLMQPWPPSLPKLRERAEGPSTKNKKRFRPASAGAAKPSAIDLATDWITKAFPQYTPTTIPRENSVGDVKTKITEVGGPRFSDTTLKRAMGRRKN